MAKGGRGSLRPSYGRPKLTLVSRFVALQLQCQGSKSLRQFSSEKSEANRSWTLLFGLHILFVSKRSDENWQSDFDQSHLMIFRNTTVCWPMTWLWATITLKRRLGHPNRLYFLNPECVRTLWVPAPKKFFQYFRVRSVLQNITFSRISRKSSTPSKISIENWAG